MPPHPLTLPFVGSGITVAHSSIKRHIFSSMACLNALWKKTRDHIQSAHTAAALVTRELAGIWIQMTSPRSSTPNHPLHVLVAILKAVTWLGIYRVWPCHFLPTGGRGSNRLEHVAAVHVVRAGGPEVVAPSSSLLVLCHSESLSLHSESLSRVTIEISSSCSIALSEGLALEQSVRDELAIGVDVATGRTDWRGVSNTDILFAHVHPLRKPQTHWLDDRSTQDKCWHIWGGKNFGKWLTWAKYKQSGDHRHLSSVNRAAIAAPCPVGVNRHLCLVFNALELLPVVQWCKKVNIKIINNSRYGTNENLIRDKTWNSTDKPNQNRNKI